MSISSQAVVVNLCKPLTCQPKYWKTKTSPSLSRNKIRALNISSNLPRAPPLTPQQLKLKAAKMKQQELRWQQPRFQPHNNKTVCQVAIIVRRLLQGAVSKARHPRQRIAQVSRVVINKLLLHKKSTIFCLTINIKMQIWLMKTT